MTFIFFQKQNLAKNLQSTPNVSTHSVDTEKAVEVAEDSAILSSTRKRIASSEIVDLTADNPPLPASVKKQRVFQLHCASSPKNAPIIIQIND
mmetsp:Transcript_1726/g.3057  ORF Transcript_1726/g.3057 Transcript_1726/m.3057 type:complete len:93 (+) Transcript_1726:1613-1891(+)